MKSKIHTRETSNQGKAIVWLQWIAMGVILVIAVMRCVIVFAPQVIFDVDPVIDSSRLAGLGMGGSLFLDALLMLACGIALYCQWRSGRGINRLLVMLALLPVPVMLWHGGYDAGNLWKGSTWCAAAMSCITIAHLARDRNLKIVIVSVLLAVVVPLMVRGVGQMTYEHDELIAEFEQNKEYYFSQHGWAPDSPSARIYERRLRNAEPRGWFATTNIFATVMALALSMYLGLIIASVKAGLPGGWWATMGLVMLGVGAGLWACDSLGAMMAALGGLVILLAPMMFSRVRTLCRRFGGTVLILMLITVMLGVVVRGSLLPEGFAGDKSLLFRWHYTIGAVRTFAAAPLTGVGPDGFQEAYIQHRPPRNPEEVSSTHNMFEDWLCGLGISGTAWIALVMLLVGKAGNALRSDKHDEADAALVRRKTLIIATSAAAIGLGLGMAIELMTSLDPMIILLRLLGAGVFIAVAGIMARIMVSADSRIIDWGLFAGVGAMLIHGQIEMTFAQPGAVVWAMCMIGAIGFVGKGSSSRFAALLPGLMVGIALWVVIAGVVPASRQGIKMQSAADVLHDFPDDPRSRVERRKLAADELLAAFVLMPSNLFPLERAAQQLVLASNEVEGGARIELMHQALRITDMNSGRETGGEPGSLISLRFNILFDLARREGDESLWQRTLEEATKLTDRDPQGNVSWQRRGHVLWEFGRREEAIEAYRRALEADDAFELDPLKQFSSREREMIESRVGE
ncbi:MAG: O-antigen ligase family protein [Planctomycetes bacterium]|nr:O-antigen ligase family protein [Planctomycetota bacterium]